MKVVSCVQFSFSLSPTASTSGYKFYHGSSEPEVFAQRGQASTSWADILSSSRTSTDICLSPVHRSCVSVDTMEWYKTQMNIVREYYSIIESVCSPFK